MQNEVVIPMIKHEERVKVVSVNEVEKDFVSIPLCELGEVVIVLGMTKEENGIETTLLGFDEVPEWLQKAADDEEIKITFDEDNFMLGIKVKEEEGYKDAHPTDRIVKWKAGGLSVMPSGCFYEE